MYVIRVLKQSDGQSIHLGSYTKFTTILTSSSSTHSCARDHRDDVLNSLVATVQAYKGVAGRKRVILQEWGVVGVNSTAQVWPPLGVDSDSP